MLPLCAIFIGLPIVLIVLLAAILRRRKARETSTPEGTPPRGGVFGLFRLVWRIVTIFLVFALVAKGFALLGDALARPHENTRSRALAIFILFTAVPIVLAAKLIALVRQRKAKETLAPLVRLPVGGGGLSGPFKLIRRVVMIYFVFFFVGKAFELAADGIRPSGPRKILESHHAS